MNLNLKRYFSGELANSLARTHIVRPGKKARIPVVHSMWLKGDKFI